ncbi:glutamate synthase subunit beta [bacterium]|nr:glutamate synthase subunit beta [bacterium]
MKDIKAFLKTKRQTSKYRPKEERLKDYKEVTIKRDDEQSMSQAGRCMDCGTPFCHWACPIGNYIPEWNDLAAAGKWKQAYKVLSQSSVYPEFTARVCPALCESSCVLGINDDPITVRENELAIIEHAFKNGYIKPNLPKKCTGKKIAVVGAGPAGLAAAIELNKKGHSVTVFEKDKKAGGILRYGIPDFKLEKWVIDRRIDVLKAEGIEFKTGVNVGIDISAKDLKKQFDVICLTGGSRQARDLNIPGRELDGIYFAMDYLTQSNKNVSGEKFDEQIINAKGKKVLVIGGGDTGSDCIGTANRQHADNIVQVEVMPKPTEERPVYQPWPVYPNLLKITSSHLEGCERMWSVLTKKFVGKDGKLQKVECVKVEFVLENGKQIMKEIKGSEFEIEADMAILAIGFVHPEHNKLLEDLGVEYDQRGNVKTNDKYETSVQNVFSAGDMHKGQSLVVWAMQEGRNAAAEIDEIL